jgi:hypothetical protein
MMMGGMTKVDGYGDPSPAMKVFKKGVDKV